MYKTETIKIGLPKGNLYNKSIKFVEAFTHKSVPKNQLHISFSNIDFYFLKHRDIPQLVEKEILDFGITSDEWIIETNTNTKRILETNWCDTTISLITAKGTEISDIKTCVSEYPFLTEKQLNNINKDIDIYYVSGSCESLVPTIFDSCVGCIETGETLKINGLVVLKELTKSKTVLICNYSINDKLVQSFINQMEGLL